MPAGTVARNTALISAIPDGAGIGRQDFDKHGFDKHDLIEPGPVEHDFMAAVDESDLVQPGLIEPDLVRPDLSGPIYQVRSD